MNTDSHHTDSVSVSEMQIKLNCPQLDCSLIQMHGKSGEQNKEKTKSYSDTMCLTTFKRLSNSSQEGLRTQINLKIEGAVVKYREGMPYLEDVDEL